ncbi:restriction endonuclease subunit S [Legionella septentrionalis]|uniref:restriction endonuclease subunit S n=1 Tax=Legionella septentrionalis TaxID=2498109 RepID=UPI000F8D6A40|nr:restriction endonuclease subunit S [Legionella septentrionalis]RUQ93707.1 restriction endonuclease subunit S [Legionella septentrionalis]
MVPKEWINVSLGDVITYKKGFAFDSSNFQSHGVQIIRISDTTSNSISLKNPIYVSKEVAAKLTAFIVHEGDIVLSTVGSRPHLVDSMVGKAVRIPKETEGSLLNQNLVKLIPKKSVIINDYLYLMVKKSRFIYFISTLIRGNANQVSITLKELFKYKFPLPPLIEQKKITQILSTWDKAITTTEKLLVNSEQQKKALVQQLLTGKKRFSEFQEAWKIKTVSDFGHVVTGNTPSKAIKKNYGDSICWATAEDFKSKYINDTRIKLSQEGALRARVLPAGSVLITCIASIGKNAIASTTLATNQQINAVIINTENSNEYFYYLMEFHKKELIALAGTTAVPILNKASFQKIKVFVPSFEEQRKIAALLATVDIQRENLKMQLEKLCNEKKALMQQLLTGKRRVQV